MRFPYWPVRVDRGGEVLVPGEYADPVQWIDARDLAEFTIHLCEQSMYGIYNTCSPPFPMGQMLEEVKAGVDSDATFTWVPEDFLNEHEVLRQLDSLGSTLVRNPDYAGYNQYNVDKAVAAGLTFRPVGETSRDTVEWYKTLAEEDRPRGRLLTPEREAEVLAAWHESQQGAVV
jgi:2'-hydroxyisoflavone reductase